jgi:hypothetical protein
MGWSVKWVLVGVLVGAVACSGGSAGHARPAQPPATGAPADCPPTTGRGQAAVDYVDFVQVSGRQYIANLGGRQVPPVKRQDLGRVVTRSRCSLSALNDATHRAPGAARDGDSGFLPPGTPVYAVHGWSTRCRLAAEHDGRLNVYLAYRSGGRVATPMRCALSRR